MAGEGLILEVWYWFLGFQVVIKQVFGKKAKVEFTVRYVEPGLEWQEGYILKPIQQGINLYRISPVVVEAAVVIGHVGTKGEITLITEFYAIGIIGKNPIITDNTFPLGIQA